MGAGTDGAGKAPAASSSLSSDPAVGLALAGGGPGGAIYEIGALRALEEAVEGLDLNDLDVYVGVSAGAFIAACLTNGLTAAQMARAIVKPDPGEHPFTPENFLTPAVGELLRRSLTLPTLVYEAIGDYLKDWKGRSLKESVTYLSRALPVGVFDSDPIREYIHRIYSIKGRSDDFRQLGKHLIIVAADLDSGEAVRFGSPGFDHVPISRAVQASVALPGLYSPVEVDGRYYVDGVLLKTLHASVALEAGAELLICINPIVPVDTVRAVEQGIMKRGKLIDRGLPTVLSQTFRTLIRSRLDAGMSRYREVYQDRDIVLLEPKRDDYEMFFRNIFSFRGRHDLCEHAYRATRAELRARYEELAPAFARHGLTLRKDVLEEPRDLWQGVGLPTAKAKPRAGVDVVDRLDQLLNRIETMVEGSAAGG